MGSIFYVMAILGCGDSEAACQQVRIEQTRYVSADACAAASQSTLERNSDVAFPVVMTECRAIGAQQTAAVDMENGGWPLRLNRLRPSGVGRSRKSEAGGCPIRERASGG